MPNIYAQLGEEIDSLLNQLEKSEGDYLSKPSMEVEYDSGMQYPSMQASLREALVANPEAPALEEGKYRIDGAAPNVGVGEEFGDNLVVVVHRLGEHAKDVMTFGEIEEGSLVASIGTYTYKLDTIAAIIGVTDFKGNVIEQV